MSDRTVYDAIAELIIDSERDCYEAGDYAIDACSALGLSVDTQLSRLRADLAIAARARACPASTAWDGSPEGANYESGWNDCRAYLLNGEQPHV